MFPCHIDLIVSVRYQLAKFVNENLREKSVFKRTKIGECKTLLNKFQRN